MPSTPASLATRGGSHAACNRAPHRAAMTALLALLGAVCGCESGRALMPTPNLYAGADWDPFAAVPPPLQADAVSILYFTDRAPGPPSVRGVTYGDGRSRSAAFGTAVVRFGSELTWAGLVEASRSPSRDRPVRIEVESVEEVERFPPTPAALIVADAQWDESVTADAPDPAHVPADAAFMAELERRIAITPGGEVFVFVHGFANSFDDAILTCAELWHFLGRESVPVCYAWPAAKGLIRAYEYTVGSTEFTTFHFRQFLRLLAETPGVERINIIAHSRGTAVTMDGLRELLLELSCRQDGSSAIKLGDVLLAAPDIDLDVAIQRDATERIGRMADRNAIYICHHDKALDLASWLSGGIFRLGDFDPAFFTPAEVEALRHSQRLQLVDARVTDLGPFGHSYFHHNPAVSSDLILYLRYGLPAGAPPGRPLGVSPEGLWLIENGYPWDEWRRSPPIADHSTRIQPGPGSNAEIAGATRAVSGPRSDS